MTIAIVSLFRSELDTDLDDRIEHLLSKGSVGPACRWIWGVGDGRKGTRIRLKMLARDLSKQHDIEVVEADARVKGDDAVAIRTRTAHTASACFARVRDTDSHVLLHESDLISPLDIIPRLLQADRLSPHLPIAAWPVIELVPGAPQFYDIWAYRDIAGNHFTPHQVRPKRVFQVSSFGSLWLTPANLIRNRVLGPDAVVGLCRQWISEGVRLWVDPRITVIQPVERWKAC